MYFMYIICSERILSSIMVFRLLKFEFLIKINIFINLLIFTEIYSKYIVFGK